MGEENEANGVPRVGEPGGVEPVFVGEGDRDPGDETDARGLVELTEDDPAKFGGARVRVPIVEPRGGEDEVRVRGAGPLPPIGAGHAGFADSLAVLEGRLLDDDELVRLEQAVSQPGDLSGELEAYVSVEDVQALVVTAMAERDAVRRIAGEYVERHGPIFQAIMELALVAALAELDRQDLNVVRADANGVITMLVARGPLAGELAAWADTKIAA